MDYRPQELLIDVIAGLLEGIDSIAVGVLSPVPGSAAMLAEARAGRPIAVSVVGEQHDGAAAPAQPGRQVPGRQIDIRIIGTNLAGYRTDGGIDIFDAAGQGRIGAFFLSGGQIDGQGNINLLGAGDYPGKTARWSGSFGSAFLYYVVPRVILFREEHTTRTLVEKVDFISAAGTSPPNVHRPGGPYALVTGRCVFRFDRDRGRFRLAGVHPGHGVAEVRENTGFEFDCPAEVPETPAPSAETLRIVRHEIAPRIADPYPKFAADVLGYQAPPSAAG